jgi:DNA-binding transcriptional regulator GbsR (MarR family)
VTEAERIFVESLEQHLVRRGLSRTPARIWAWLLVCEPADQSAEDLAAHLHASRGAISAAVRDLAALGIIRRGRRRGERRERFTILPGSIRRLVADMERVLREGREIADDGLAAIGDRSPEARARLQEFRDVYAYYEDAWPAVVKRYLEERAERAPATMSPEVLGRPPRSNVEPVTA